MIAEQLAQRIAAAAGTLLAAAPSLLSREAREDSELLQDAAQRLIVTIRQLPSGDLHEHAQHPELVHRLLMLVNTVLGFSRLMLKGIDGALEPDQEQIVEQIQDDSIALKDYLYDLFNIVPPTSADSTRPYLQRFSVERLFRRLNIDAEDRLLTRIDDADLIYADRLRTQNALRSLVWAASRRDPGRTLALEAHGRDRQIELILTADAGAIPTADPDLLSARDLLSQMGAELRPDGASLRFLLPRG